MKGQTRRIWCAVGVALLLAASQVGAQATSGSIRGVVTDPEGGVIPGVTVLAISSSLVAGQQSAITSEQGVFRFPSLPVGSYVLEAHMPGFQSVRRENVVVALGQDQDVSLQLGDVTISEEIVVVAEAMQVSTVDNKVDFNLGESYIERQPLSRDPVDLMNYAPGIQNDQAYGAPSTYQNAYNVDGVDVSDPELGSQWVLPSMDWVEEVQVAGLGADAEYGGFTGAVINLVTKSGGNDFHGDVRAYYSGSGLNSENTPEGVEGANTVDSYLDASVNLGGPIVTDKVWFFASGNWSEEVVEPFFASGAPDGDREQNTETRETLIGKITWQLNASNRLLGLVDYDGKTEDYRGVGDVTLASASQRQDSPNFVYNLSLESLINNANFLVAKVTGFTGSDDRLSYGSLDEPGRYDLDSGFEWVNQDQTGYKDVDRLAVDASWNLFADGLIATGDSHDFKFGILVETFSSEYITHRNGGFTYVDDSYYGGSDGYGCATLDDYFGDPSCALYSSDRGGEWSLRADMDGVHAYAQDSWKVGRFAVNLGVRYSSYAGNFKDPVADPTNGTGDVYSQDMWSPRAGVVWDLLGDGDTALKFHYGRYYEGLTVTMFDREASGNALSDTEYWDWDFDAGEWFENGGTVEARATMDGDIGHPYVDQYVATLEHQLGRNMLVGVDYIHRETKSINAMVVANVDDYDPQIAPDNPFGGGDLPFYDLLDEQQYLITNPEIATRDYDSVALRARRRYAGGWSLDGSLVWSDLTGTADYSYTGYDTGFDDQNGFVNADGTLPFNSEWVLKISGSVDLPWKILLSGFYQYRTGEYWTPYVRMRGLYYNDRTSVFLTPRGSQQYDDRDVLDLRLQKDFGLGERMVLGLFVDAFNVFDSDKVTDLVERWGDYYYDYTNPGVPDWAPSSAFMDPESIQTPREIRLGAKLSW